MLIRRSNYFPHSAQIAIRLPGRRALRLRDSKLGRGKDQGNKLTELSQVFYTLLMDRILL